MCYNVAIFYWCGRTVIKFKIMKFQYNQLLSISKSLVSEALIPMPIDLKNLRAIV